MRRLSEAQKKRFLTKFDEGVASSPVLTALNVRVRALRGRFYFERIWDDDADDLEVIGRVTPLAKPATLLLEAEPDILAYKSFPKDHWKRIHSTNLLERLNKEIKRRTKVVGVFPDRPSVMRLVGTLLNEIDDDWRGAQRRYFSLNSMRLLFDPDKMNENEPSSFLVELTSTIGTEA